MSRSGAAWVFLPIPKTEEAFTAGSTHVVVVGGGYAGVMAANRLTLREGV